MTEAKIKKDGRQEQDSQVSFHDAKQNKMMVGGSINGFAIRHVTNPTNVFKHPIRVPGRIRGLDNSWKGKKVLVILLE